MNDMRKLMEAVENISAVDLLDEYKGKVINEGWDPKAIAQAIHNEYLDSLGPIRQAAKDSVEPYRAMIYKFGELSQLYNPASLDGSEIYHEIVDALELLVAGPGYDGDDPLTGEEGAADYVEEDKFEDDVAEERRRALSSLAHILAAEVYSVMRSRPNGEEHRDGMTGYIMSQVMKELRSQVDNIVDNGDE